MVVENPTAGKISVTECPVTLNGDVTHDAAPASEHGQYTEEALLRSVTGRNRGTARAQGDMTINILTDAPQSNRGQAFRLPADMPRVCAHLPFRLRLRRRGFSLSLRRVLSAIRLERLAWEELRCDSDS